MLRCSIDQCSRYTYFEHLLRFLPNTAKPSAELAIYIFFVNLSMRRQKIEKIFQPQFGCY